MALWRPTSVAVAATDSDNDRRRVSSFASAVTRCTTAASCR